MRIAFAAGGTGGHLYPAIAVAEMLAARGRARDCFFFVSRRGVERRILEGAGFPFTELPACPIAGAAPHRLLPAAARMRQGAGRRRSGCAACVSTGRG